jgi:hypothetical protein
MKFVAMLSLVLAGFAFAANTSLGHIDAVQIIPEMAGDDIICSQPFAYAALSNGLGFSSANSWMLADDFTWTQDGIIDFIEIWAIYASGNATGFNIEIRNDTGGSGPGTVYDNTTSSAVNHTNTGLSSWGYSLWYTEITVPETSFLGGTKYWLAMQTTGGAGAHYWLAAVQTWADMNYFSQNNGSSWASSQSTWGTAYECFMIISGTTSLTRDSWGAIKTLF